MKKIILFLFLSFFLIGCSNKVPHINNTFDATSFDETVSLDEENIEMYSSKDGSSDGFKSIYFEFNSYKISQEMNSILERNLEVAQATNHKIQISGNCDEFGTDEYNYALGLKRAKAIENIFKSYNINNTTLISYGESNPICTEMKEECYLKNRRVDFKLVQ